MNIIQSPSPNFSGRAGHKPELIVVHCTEGNWASDMGWLRNPASQVSSHYIISPAGEVHQLVSETDSAWHSGRIDKPTANLKKKPDGSFINPNWYSIGIEVSLRPPAGMPDVQKTALKELIKLIAEKYNIAIDRSTIVGHKEIYSLKSCPGTINIDALVAEMDQPGSNEEIKSQIIELVKKIK